MQHDHFQKKEKLFDPTPGVKSMCQDKIIAYIMWYMHHDHFQKKEKTVLTYGSHPRGRG